jgi:hypothetical protein
MYMTKDEERFLAVVMWNSCLTFPFWKSRSDLMWKHCLQECEETVTNRMVLHLDTVNIHTASAHKLRRQHAVRLFYRPSAGWTLSGYLSFSITLDWNTVKHASGKRITCLNVTNSLLCNYGQNSSLCISIKRATQHIQKYNSPSG